MPVSTTELIWRAYDQMFAHLKEMGLTPHHCAMVSRDMAIVDHTDSNVVVLIARIPIVRV